MNVEGVRPPPLSGPCILFFCFLLGKTKDEKPDASQVIRELAVLYFWPHCT